MSKNMSNLIGAVGLILMLLAAGPAAAQAIDACDWEAAHPSDPDRVGPGRDSSDVDGPRAIAACQRALQAQPDAARFHYQLGRAQVYQADREDSDWQVGLPALERSAELGHRQGQFVLGLMRKRQGNVCAAEPLYRQAAAAGLKSARISYVNDALAGAYAACPPQATAAQMQEWLDAARGQVSGYYENMLLDALQRELSAAAADTTWPAR